MNAVTTNAVNRDHRRPAEQQRHRGGQPAPARGGHPARVGMAGGDGLGQRGGGRPDTHPAATLVDDAGDHGQPGEIGGAIAHQPHRHHRRGRLSPMAAHGDRGEGDVDVDGGQPAGRGQPRHRRRSLPRRLTTGQQHLADTHAEVQHLQHLGVRRHVRADRAQQVSGRRPAAQQVVRLAAQRIAKPAREATIRAVPPPTSGRLPLRSINRTASSRDAADGGDPTSAARSAPAGTSAIRRRPRDDQVVGRPVQVAGGAHQRADHDRRRAREQRDRHVERDRRPPPRTRSGTGRAAWRASSR